MSGEGADIVEGADTIVGDSAMASKIRGPVDEENSDSRSPRGSTTLESDMAQGNCVDSQTSTDTSEKEARNHVSDNGDHEKSTADDFTPPDDELRRKIIKQVEFYFSDVNITKDAFLLKHVRRNSMGYVSLALIASFKKMKSLTRDIRAVVFSLRQSEEVEVSEDGTKVRRRKPIPEYDDATPFKTVVAVNLEQKAPTVESVAEEFSKCQGISLIRILRPGQNIPQDLNKYANKHRELGTAVCAVIEFEKHEQARKACKTMTNTEDWRSGRRVVLLADQKKKKKENHEKSPAEDGLREGKKNTTMKYKGRADFKYTENSSSGASSSSDGESAGKLHPQPGDSNSNASHNSSETGPRTQSHKFGHRHRNKGSRCPVGGPAASQNGLHRQDGPRHKMPELSRASKETSQGETSPWVQRRLLRASNDATISKGSAVNGTGNGNSNSKLLNMVGVLRQPKGPDGTRGFSSGLGRGKPRCNTIA